MGVARKISEKDLLSLFVVDSLRRPEDLEAYLRTVLESCTRWFKTSGASIFLATHDHKTYKLVAKFGPAARTPDGATLQLGQGLAGHALLDGVPRIVVDPGIASPNRRDDIGSSMIVPLTDRAGSECIGVLNLARHTDEPVFSDSDLHFAEAVAGQIALAVRNAKLFYESQHLSETLRVVLASLEFGVVGFNADGTISHCNAEAARLLGAIPGEAEPWQSFLQRLELGAHAVLSEVVETGLGGKRNQARWEGPSQVWTIAAAPLPSHGCTLTIQDISEPERQQREFQHMQRLAEVGQITATIAHEIRNPLTGIRSAAKMIQDTPELGEEFACIIEEESVKLNKLCDEFLEFARPLRLELAQRALIEVCQRVVHLLGAEFAATGLLLVLRDHSHAQPVELDSRRLEQVIRNLVLNGLQATPKGGTVLLEVWDREFTVSDTGSGMDPQTVGRLFSPFFTTKPKGTGLGLSMVKKIVDAHKATIRVESQVGVGTRFQVILSEGVSA